MKIIHELIWRTEIDLKEYLIEKKKNTKKPLTKRSLVNRIMCGYEDRVLMVCKECLERFGCQIQTLAFDGLTVSKKSLTLGQIPHVLEMCEEAVRTEL